MNCSEREWSYSSAFIQCATDEKSRTNNDNESIQKNKCERAATASVNGTFFSFFGATFSSFSYYFFDEIDIKHKTDSRWTSVTTQSQRMQVCNKQAKTKLQHNVEVQCYGFFFSLRRYFFGYCSLLSHLRLHSTEDLCNLNWQKFKDWTLLSTVCLHGCCRIFISKRHRFITVSIIKR